MPRVISGEHEIDIGVPVDVEKRASQQDTAAPFTVPGSEQDQSFSEEKNPEIEESLEKHAKAAELDHPQSCVKLKHLEEQLRALLENFVQGDNKAVLNEDLELNGDLILDGDIEGGGLFGDSTSGADHKIFISDSAPGAGDGSDGDLWFEY